MSEKINTEHGTFTSNKLTSQAAEEVYQLWLLNKDKPQIPSVEERLQVAEDTILFLLMGGM